MRLYQGDKRRRRRRRRWRRRRRRSSSLRSRWPGWQVSMLWRSSSAHGGHITLTTLFDYRSPACRSSTLKSCEKLLEWQIFSCSTNFKIAWWSRNLPQSHRQGCFLSSFLCFRLSSFSFLCYPKAVVRGIAFALRHFIQPCCLHEVFEAEKTRYLHSHAPSPIRFIWEYSAKKSPCLQIWRNGA